MRTMAGRVLMAGTALVLTGCQALDNALAPGQANEATRAQVALVASLPRAGAPSRVDLGVTGTYLRGDGRQAPLLQRVLTLTNDREQAVPLAVDLAVCLADAARAAGPDGKGCRVTLVLTLVVEGQVVDRQVIGPLVLQPGGTARVEDPVALYDVAALEVWSAGRRVSDSEVLGITVATSTGLQGILRDRAGSEVPGRTVTWSSDAPQVASVDGEGRVTALAAGTVRITATHEEVRTTVAVRVVRAPVEVVVQAGPGMGRGRVVSVPAGIDCEVRAGSVAGTCTTRFPFDAAVTLQATPATGSRQGAWGASCAGTSSSCAFTATAGREVRIGFLAERRVVIQSAGDGHGTVTGGGLACQVDGGVVSGRCDVPMAEGATVVLQANEGDAVGTTAGSRFDRWGGACATAAALECALTAGDGDLVATIAFQAPRTVTVQVDGTGDGAVASGSESCRRAPGPTTICRWSVRHGTVVRLSASPTTPSLFGGWGGSCAGLSGAADCVLDVRRNELVRALFQNGRTLLVNPGSGDGQARITGPGGLDCVLSRGAATGSCRVVVAADTARLTLDLSGTARRQVLEGWEGACGGVRASCVVSLGSAETTVSARVHDEQRLAVSVAGPGLGSVSAATTLSCARVSGGRIAGVCSASAPWGTQVTLTATPDPVSAFVGWGGACAGNDTPTCTVQLTTALDVSASFAPRQVPLQLTLVGPGEGFVTVDGRTACAIAAGVPSVTCTVTVPLGTIVQLGATPLPSTRFGGFTGDCNASGSCPLAVTVPRAVTAQFALRTFTLTASPSGQGGGTTLVNGAPFCTLVAGGTAAPCTRTVVWGDVLLIDQAPATGSVVAALTGNCAAGGPCRVVVKADVQVAPRFEPGLRVELWPQGTGGGTMTAAGLTCTLAAGVVSGACIGYVLPGSLMTIAAAPDASSLLVTWGGSCRTSPGNTCAVTIREPQRITARFDVQP